MKNSVCLNRIDIFSVRDMFSFSVNNTDPGVQFSIWRYLIPVLTPVHPWTAAGWSRQHNMLPVNWLRLLWENGGAASYSRCAPWLDVTWLSSSSEQGVRRCDLFFVGESALDSCHGRWRWWASPWKFDDVPARATGNRRTKVLRTIKKQKKNSPPIEDKKGAHNCWSGVWKKSWSWARCRAQLRLEKKKGKQDPSWGGWEGERNNNAQMIAGKEE